MRRLDNVLSYLEGKAQERDWLVLPGAGGGLGHLGAQTAGTKAL